MLTPYLLRAPAPTADGLRLFCFHHAGGSAAAFATWQRGLGPRAEVLPVQLPGREGRLSEPRATDMTQLVDELVRELGDHFRPPFAFYGHSMGALLAYAVAQRLRDRGAALPVLLAVGAYPAPDRPGLMTDVPRMAADDLAALLVRIGGMSEMLLDYPEWRDAAIDLVRDDLRVCHSYRHVPDAPLPTPITAFVGDRDPLMTPADATPWAGHTTSGFELQPIPGGHFFLRDSAPVLLGALRRSLAAAGARRGVAHAAPGERD